MATDPLRQIQVSKGRDTGVAQVTGFTAKISMGNGMQVRRVFVEPR